MSVEQPSEIVSFRTDHNTGGMPRELKRRKSGAEPSQPALWTSPPTVEHKGEWGLYPKGFVAWAARILRAQPDRILHVCSGRLPPGTGAARVDLRKEVLPDVVANGGALPFRTGVFDAVMIDPPYSVEYAKDLYGTEYPRPSHLLREASRVTRSCGRVGILHFLVPMPPPGCRVELVRGVTQGCGYRIRAFTVFERDQDGFSG